MKPYDEAESKKMSNIPYASVVGGVMYTMVCSRSDLSHAISILSRYMIDPSLNHWDALKKVLRYMREAINLGILFEKISDKNDQPLVGFVDFDFATDLDNIRSQTEIVFTLFRTAINWKSSLQHIVALSTTEAEYLAMTETVNEGIWLRGLVSKFSLIQENMSIKRDN